MINCRSVYLRVLKIKLGIKSGFYLWTLLCWPCNWQPPGDRRGVKPVLCAHSLCNIRCIRLQEDCFSHPCRPRSFIILALSCISKNLSSCNRIIQLFRVLQVGIWGVDLLTSKSTVWVYILWRGIPSRSAKMTALELHQLFSLFYTARKGRTDK